jgi:hypothetical protein
VIEPKGRGVLDTPLSRGMTGKTNGALAVDLQPSSPAKAGDPVFHRRE